MTYKSANQAAVPTKIAGLITHPVREKRRGAKEMGTKEMSERMNRRGASTNL